MRIEIDEIINLIDSKYARETFELVDCLQNGYVPLRELKEDKIYRAALVWILKYKGYTYLSDKIYTLFNKQEIDYKEVYEALINGNIIKREKINYISNLNSEEGVSFKSSRGITKSFYIKLLKDRYPFKIKYVSNDYRGFVNCKFDNFENECRVNIDVIIPDNVKYPIDIKETIMIYTDYKILLFDFDIKKIDEVVESSFYELKILNTLKIMKERTRRIIAVGKGLERLEKEKNYDFAIEYLKSVKNKTITIEIFKKYRDWIFDLNGELQAKFYLELIEHFMDIEEVDVRVGFLIEEFILKMPLVKNNIRMYLEKLYNEGFLTENTEKVLDILKLSGLSLKMKKKFKIVDMETIEDFKEGNVSAEMAVKILNTKGVRYDKGLIEIMYDFYKDTDDVYALETVIKKKDKFNFKINDRDIVSLINRKRDGIGVSDEAILVGGRNYIDKNKYIKDEIENIKRGKKFNYGKLTQI